MDAIVERVAGVDVGQASVVATVLVGAAHERARKETRAFGTVTQDLLALRQWLLAKGVTHVALEGTGIYWRPVYEVLEDAFELILGNAHHIQNVPGRKTDVKDSEWLADLARHGLIAKGLTSETSSIDSERVAELAVLRWRSPTRSSSPPTTCSRRAARTESSASPTSTISRSAAPRRTSFAVSSGSATKLPSGRRSPDSNLVFIAE